MHSGGSCNIPIGFVLKSESEKGYQFVGQVLAEHSDLNRTAYV